MFTCMSAHNKICECEESVHGVCASEFGRRDKQLEGIKKPFEKKSDHKYQHMVYSTSKVTILVLK